MIRLKQLSKRFGARQAVDDLSLQVGQGEVYGLLGHNGAGKSTAIGMMLGQVWPTAGAAFICGYNVSTHRRHALEKVGAIFESPCFYDYLSGRKNLEILSSYTRPTSRRRIAEVVEWVGLTGRDQHAVRTYSHGMRARLALAQALLPKPDVLILDEPGDGLDPEGIHEMRLTIQRLRREMGLTILLSSHFLAEVEQLCTRIAVLNQGRMVFEGTLASTKPREPWFRLRVDDFTLAVRRLKEAGLVEAERAGQLIALRPDIGSDEVVRALVGWRMPVFEIAPAEQTLEDFYLSLISGHGASPPNLSATDPPP